jgi:hypothetical protein
MRTDEIPDILGFKSWGYSYLVEVKVSKSDFLSDGDKRHRKIPSLGMGHVRYYLVPAGLISAEEVPSGWGLLTYNKGKVNVTVEVEPPSGKRKVDPKITAKEAVILIHQLEKVTRGEPDNCYREPADERILGAVRLCLSKVKNSWVVAHAGVLQILDDLGGEYTSPLVVELNEIFKTYSALPVNPANKKQARLELARLVQARKGKETMEKEIRKIALNFVKWGGKGISHIKKLENFPVGPLRNTLIEIIKKARVNGNHPEISNEILRVLSSDSSPVVVVTAPVALEGKKVNTSSCKPS